MILSGKKNIHFVGMGGIGMSAIAHVLLQMGHNIAGSDLKANSITKRLEALGALMHAGHRASNLGSKTDLLVYSSSISSDNPEMLEASRRGIKIMHRAEMLGHIFNSKDGIAVTGTHGKTTTTSLIAVMLNHAGVDPTVMVGGEVSAFGGNARLGKGRYIVAEADESDSSFHHLKPQSAVITNIEMEHTDHFETLDHVISSYKKFIGNIKKGGRLFYNRDDRNISKVLRGHRVRSENFGFSKDADMYAEDIVMEGFSTSFMCIYKERALGRVSLKIPGRHNILNAMAAILMGLDIGIAFKVIVSSLGTFEGATRRFQLRANHAGAMLIDDYAHHPTEIRAVLDACRSWRKKRLIAVFQPHRYSRTRYFAKEFGSAFKGVDKLVLTDIYGASEKMIEGVSIKTVYDKVKASGNKDVIMLKKQDIAPYLMKIKRPGDIILILGAGDIKEVADKLVRIMNHGTPALMPATMTDAEELRKLVRGKIKAKEDLSRHTSLRIGGPADIWAEPAGISDLKKTILFARKQNIPFYIIGNGSNLLASDSGFKGMLIHLGADRFKSLKISGPRVCVGAGYSLPKLVALCCQKGLSGMESLVGIPGTVGGAIFMNAGGYTNPVYKNIGSMVESVKVMDYSGNVKRVKAKEISFDYRSSSLDGSIILEADLKLGRGNSKDLQASRMRFLKMKKDKQALDIPNAGCVFKNPNGFHFTCGQMIDMLRLKGRRIGGAEVSEKHANFIINRGHATYRDVMELIDLIRREVRDNYKVDLELEIKVI